MNASWISSQKSVLSHFRRGHSLFADVCCCWDVSTFSQFQIETSGGLCPLPPRDLEEPCKGPSSTTTTSNHEPGGAERSIGGERERYPGHSCMSAVRRVGVALPAVRLLLSNLLHKSQHTEITRSLRLSVVQRHDNAVTHCFSRARQETLAMCDFELWFPRRKPFCLWQSWQFGSCCDAKSDLFDGLDLCFPFKTQLQLRKSSEVCGTSFC